MTSEPTPDTAPPSLVDLIDKLVLPSEPSRISMVPQTAGWAVLGIAVLIALAIGARRYVRYRRRNAYRRLALDALAGAGADPAAIAAVLRRCALAAYPRARVAGLSGPDWLAFLDQTLGRDAFSSGAGQVLATAAYRKEDAAGPALIQLARDWVRHHRAEPAP